MRGLTQAAAAVLTPVLVLAHGPHHPPPPPPPMGFLPSALDVTPSAFVTLNVPWSDTEAYPLVCNSQSQQWPFAPNIFSRHYVLM